MTIGRLAVRRSRKLTPKGGKNSAFLRRLTELEGLPPILRCAQSFQDTARCVPRHQVTLYFTTFADFHYAGTSVAAIIENVNFSISGQEVGEAAGAFRRLGAWFLDCLHHISKATTLSGRMMMDAVSKPWRIHSGPVSGLRRSRDKRPHHHPLFQFTLACTSCLSASRAPWPSRSFCAATSFTGEIVRRPQTANRAPQLCASALLVPICGKCPQRICRACR